MNVKSIPHNMMKIKLIIPNDAVKASIENLRTFTRAIRTLLDWGNLKISFDGKPIAKVEFVYCDTDGWFVFVKESTLYEQLKYAIDWYVTPIGIIEDGKYKTFTGFNLHVIEEDS